MVDLQRDSTTYVNKNKKQLFIKSLDTYFAVLKVEQTFYIENDDEINRINVLYVAEL